MVVLRHVAIVTFDVKEGYTFITMFYVLFFLLSIQLSDRKWHIPMFSVVNLTR